MNIECHRCEREREREKKKTIRSRYDLKNRYSLLINIYGLLIYCRYFFSLLTRITIRRVRNRYSNRNETVCDWNKLLFFFFLHSRIVVIWFLSLHSGQEKYWMCGQRIKQRKNGLKIFRSCYNRLMRIENSLQERYRMTTMAQS